MIEITERGMSMAASLLAKTTTSAGFFTYGPPYNITKQKTV
jgi:hypothetical protein